MCNYVYFRALYVVYAEYMLFIMHTQTLQYIFLCLTTLRTHITSHTLLYYILTNIYMNRSIIANKFVVFTHNYVEKKKNHEYLEQIHHYLYCVYIMIY